MREIENHCLVRLDGDNGLKMTGIIIGQRETSSTWNSASYVVITAAEASQFPAKILFGKQELPFWVKLEMIEPASEQLFSVFPSSPEKHFVAILEIPADPLEVEEPKVFPLIMQPFAKGTRVRVLEKRAKRVMFTKKNDPSFFTFEESMIGCPVVNDGYSLVGIMVEGAKGNLKVISLATIMREFYTLLDKEKPHILLKLQDSFSSDRMYTYITQVLPKHPANAPVSSTTLKSVYFATNRFKEENVYTAKLGPLTYGKVEYGLYDLVKEFTPLSTIQLQSIQEELKALPKNDLVLFIHGFDTSFDAAIHSSILLKENGNPAYEMLTFAWCCNNRGKISSRYENDLKNTDEHAKALQETLQNVYAAQKAKGGKIHLVCHSMGALIFLRTLQKLKQAGSEVHLGKVIFCSPDITLTEKEESAQLVVDAAEKGQVYSYYCPMDVALKMGVNSKVGGETKVGMEGWNFEGVKDVKVEFGQGEVKGFVHHLQTYSDVLKVLEGNVE